MRFNSLNPFRNSRRHRVQSSSNSRSLSSSAEFVQKVVDQNKGDNEMFSMISTPPTSQRLNAFYLREEILEFLDEKSEISTIFGSIFYSIDSSDDVVLIYPPAAKRAISSLPSARVYPFDKERLENSNVECSVCMEQLSDGVAISRMPCGHVFHINCIVAWLGQSCACPECRYEIETMDQHYEIGRKNRMKERATFTCNCPSKQSGLHRCFFPQDEYLTLKLEPSIVTTTRAKAA
jgi:Ring finger domain